MAESDSNKISVYYGYSDDINILLGTYEKTPSGSDSNDHGGVYRYTHNYTMYNDGYYVYKGTLTFNSSIPSIQVTFDQPFKTANYMLIFDPSAPGISVSSRYTTNFIAYYKGYSSLIDKLSINYEATGQWK